MSKKVEFFELLDEILVEMEDIVENKKNEDAEYETKIEQLKEFRAVLIPEVEEENETEVTANLIRTDAAS